MSEKTKNEISKVIATSLLEILKHRFENNKNRNPHIEWENIENKLKAFPKKLWSLNEMEKTGGEPDVVAYDKENDTYLLDFYKRLL